MIGEPIYTAEQIAEYLQVPVEVIQKEIAAGKLAALDVAGHTRISASALAMYKDAVHQQVAVSTNDAGAKQNAWLQLSAAPDFRYKWPDGKDEQYVEVREGVATYNGRSYRVKLGFTTRKSAGRVRRRSLVLVDRYATVEFVAPDDKSVQCKMASIIRDRAGKQLPVGAAIPPEYQELPVAPYADVVTGPGASNGLAVVCDSQDFPTMVKHALVRYRYREDRKK